MIKNTLINYIKYSLIKKELQLKESKINVCVECMKLLLVRLNLNN